LLAAAQQFFKITVKTVKIAWITGVFSQFYGFLPLFCQMDNKTADSDPVILLHFPIKLATSIGLGLFSLTLR
jgi:hypothetical protein